MSAARGCSCSFTRESSAVRMYSRSACTHGQYAGAPPASQQRPSRPGPARLGKRRSLVRQPALADPGLAGDQEKGHPPHEGLVEGRLELG